MHRRAFWLGAKEKLTCAKSKGKTNRNAPNAAEKNDSAQNDEGKTLAPGARSRFGKPAFVIIYKGSGFVNDGGGANEAF